jgi:hypothetical protein
VTAGYTNIQWEFSIIGEVNDDFVVKIDGDDAVANKETVEKCKPDEYVAAEQRNAVTDGPR